MLEREATTMQGGTTEQRYSIGGAAQLLDVSPSRIRKLERSGIIPPAPRLAGSERDGRSCSAPAPGGGAFCRAAGCCPGAGWGHPRGRSRRRASYSVS